MSAKIDIAASATRFNLEFGEYASIFAVMKADACAAAGDLDGKVAWLKVIEAIKVSGDPSVSLGTPTVH